MTIIDRQGVSVDDTDSPVLGDPNPGLAIKVPCLVATTGANIVLAGVQVIDGVTVGDNSERVLVKDNTDATTNGLYNASSGNWTRAVDMQSNSQITPGMLLVVVQGALNARLVFELISPYPVTLGTSALTFASAAAVQGPASSVDGHVAVFLGTSGGQLKDSGETIAQAVTPPGEYRIEAFGAVGDGVGPVTGAINSGQFNFTRATGNFVSGVAPAGDVGKLIVVQSAGVGGLALCATITAVAGPIATLNASASATVASGPCWYGTDNAAAIEAAWAAAKATGGTVRAGNGTFAFGHSLNFANAIGVTLQGVGLQSGAGPTDFGTFFWPLCDLSATTGNAFDPSGSTHVNFKDFQLGRGDLPNRISAGILVAGHSGAESICWSFENVLVMGNFLLSGIYQYGVPNCRYTDVQTYNSLQGLGTSYGAQFTCNNHGGAASAYGSLNTGAIDTSDVYALNCQFAEVANMSGLSTSGGALRLNGVDSFTFESGFLGSTHRCMHISDTTANWGSRNVRISQTSLQGYPPQGPVYCCEIDTSQTINGLKFEDCRAVDGSLDHTQFTGGPTTAFLQITGVPPLIRELRITGGLRVNTALINGGTGTTLALTGAYIEANGAPIAEPGSVDNSNIYVNPGVIVPQAGGQSEAEIFPRKTVANASYSFNLENRFFGAGTAAAPTCWTLSGTSAAAAKNTTAGQFEAAPQGVTLTRASGDARLSQAVTSIPRWANLAGWQGKTVTFGRWVYATVAGRARISIFDGVTRTFSSYHSGGSDLEFLTVTVQLSFAATAVTLENNVDTGNTSAVFSGGAFVIGNGLKPVAAQPNEWQGAASNITLTTGAATIAANSTHAFLIGIDTAQTPVAFAGVLSGFAVVSAAAAGAGQSFTYTLRKNTGATSITTSISGASQTSANDLVDQVAVAARDTIDILAVISTSGAATTHGGCLRLDEVPF